MPNPKLTKAELVETIYEKTDVTRTDAHEILDLLFAVIKDGLFQDRVVELRGFGTFEIRSRKGRSLARNPKTGESVAFENYGVAYFRPGNELKAGTFNLRR